jgi:hypothetical protein
VLRMTEQGLGAEVATLRHTAIRVTGVSVAIAAIASTGPIGLYLVCGLIYISLGLIITVALVGVFGDRDQRNAAQNVLAQLLGREPPRNPTPPPDKPTLQGGSSPPPAAAGKHSRWRILRPRRRHRLGFRTPPWDCWLPRLPRSRSRPSSAPGRCSAPANLGRTSSSRPATVIPDAGRADSDRPPRAVSGMSSRGTCTNARPRRLRREQAT